MSIDCSNVKFDFSKSDNDKFRDIVLDILTKQKSIENLDDTYNGIGTLGEKKMHSAIKSFICPDIDKHEILIDNAPNPENDNNQPKVKKRKFVADILDGDTIYEIQTGGFSPLKNKINWILENTSYNVVLIHPIAQTKMINWISPTSGKITTRRKSNVTGKIQDIAPELYFITQAIRNPRFSLILFMVEADEFKKKHPSTGGWGKREKIELIPNALLHAYIFKNSNDYKIFIPTSLPELFTAKEYSSHTQIYGIDTYSMLKTLCQLDLLKTDGNIGKSVAYCRNF